MAISATAVWKPTRDAVITLALRRGGWLHAGHTARAETLALGAEFLATRMQALQARGVQLHTVEFYSQALTESLGSYTAPADTISVEAGAIVRAADGLTDAPLRLLTPENYYAIPTKATDALPATYHTVHSADGITIFLDPRPDATWAGTLIYPRVRRLRDVDTGAVNLDVPPKFHLALSYGLCADFVTHFKQPIERVMHFESKFEEELGVQLGDENPRGNVQFCAPDLWCR